MILAAMGGDRRQSDFSRAAETDGNLASLEDDRHLAPAVSQLQHALQSLLVGQDVDVIKRNLTAGVVLPGAPGERSEFLAEDRYFLFHGLVRLVSIIKIGAGAPNCK
jgi:hypothetical protein